MELSGTDGGKWALRKSRLAARRRQQDGKPCPWCDVTMEVTRNPMSRSTPTLEHLVAQSKFPANSDVHKKTIYVCRKCNNNKGNLSLDEYERKLRLKGPQALHGKFVRWMKLSASLVEWARLTEASLEQLDVCSQQRDKVRRMFEGLTKKPD